MNSIDLQTFPPLTNVAPAALCKLMMERIREFSKELAQRYSPERVILFGSRARTDAGADSDADILVIIEHAGKNAYLAAEMRTELRPSFPLDLIVRRPSDIEKRLALGDPFIREILLQGEVLHDANRP